MKVQRMMVSFGVFWLGLALGQPVVGLADTQKPEDLVTVNYWIRARIGYSTKQVSDYLFRSSDVPANKVENSQLLEELSFLKVKPAKRQDIHEKPGVVNWVYDTTKSKGFPVKVYYMNGHNQINWEQYYVTSGAVVSLHAPKNYRLENKADVQLRIMRNESCSVDVPVVKDLGNTKEPQDSASSQAEGRPALPGSGNNVATGTPSGKPDEVSSQSRPTESEKTKPTDSEKTESLESKTPEPDQSVIVEPGATVKPNHSNTGENETAKPDNSNQSSSDGTKPTGNQPTGTVDKESHGQATATGKQPAGQPEKPKPEEPAQVTPLPAPSITNGGALDKGTPSNKQPQQPTKKPTEGTKPGDSSHRPAPVAQQPPVVSRPLVETNSTVAPLPVTAEPEKPIVTVPHVPVRLPHTSPLAHQEAPLLPDNVPAKEPARKPQRPQLRRRTPDKTSAANLTGEMPARPSLPHTSHSRLPQTNEVTNPFHWGGLVLLVTLMGSALTRRIRR